MTTMTRVKATTGSIRGRKLAKCEYPAGTIYYTTGGDHVFPADVSDEQDMGLVGEFDPVDSDRFWELLGKI